MSEAPLRVAVLGMGWWSDVLADAIKRSNEFEIVACFTRSEDKRQRLRREVRLPRRRELRGDPRRSLDRRRSSTRRPTTCTWRPRGRRRKPASTSSSTSRSPTRCAEGLEIAEVCKKAGVVLALGYQRRRESHFRWIKSEIDAGRFGKLVQAECNISRDRLGTVRSLIVALHGGRHAGRRHAADRHPLCRRAGIPDGAGQERVGAVWPSSCCRATTPTSPT